MIKVLRICAICVFAVGLITAFYFIPTDRVNSEPGNSPLFNSSLASTTDHLVGRDNPVRSEDGKGGGQGNLVTCELTCGPTCNQTTCGVTCVQTCEFTCANTCNQTTCNSTCVATCAATCANTCSQPTCESTCIVTCSYTCTTPITMVSFSAEGTDSNIAVRWTTASQIDNYRFVIYRTTNPDGEFTPIADVRSEGQGVGNTNYVYNDVNVTPGTTYYYQISDVSIYGYETVHPVIASATIGNSMAVAADFAVMQNFPNPFNPETTIRFSLPTTSQAQLAVYDMSGRLVRNLVNGQLTAGSHEVTWNATDNAGNTLPSGMYIYRLVAGEHTAAGKMLFVK